MQWLIEVQHWLYGGMAAGIKSAEHMSALPALLASAVLFGAVHAFMPGHGKSVLVSYHLGRPGRVWDGFVTGTVLALTHVGSAVVFIMVGVAVISRSLAAAGRAPAFETASAILIIATGIFLLWRTARPHEHDYSGDGKVLAFVTGLVPCPLNVHPDVRHRKTSTGGRLCRRGRNGNRCYRDHRRLRCRCCLRAWPLGGAIIKNRVP
jgi:hypothetical protein